MRTLLARLIHFTAQNIPRTPHDILKNLNEWLEFVRNFSDILHSANKKQTDTHTNNNPSSQQQKQQNGQVGEDPSQSQLHRSLLFKAAPFEDVLCRVVFFSLMVFLLFVFSTSLTALLLMCEKVSRAFVAYGEVLPRPRLHELIIRMHLLVWNSRNSVAVGIIQM